MSFNDKLNRELKKITPPPPSFRLAPSHEPNCTATRRELFVSEGLICCENLILITDRQVNLFVFPLWHRESNRRFT